MPFIFEKTEIPDVILIKPKIFRDDRGYFLEVYKQTDFKKAGIAAKFVQVNHSMSKYGVLRGLHFQKEPFAQAKLVRCIRGIIYDVAVDLRKDSPTFGKFVARILSEYNKHMLFIPRGFAHGFLVLSDIAEVEYLVDNVYAPDSESGLIWNDPNVKIPWPIENPLLSEKDKKWPTLKKLIDTDNIF